LGVLFASALRLIRVCHQEYVDTKHHLFAKVSQVRLASGVSKQILEKLPGLEEDFYFDPHRSKPTTLLELKDVLLKGSKTGAVCVWYENLSMQRKTNSALKGLLAEAKVRRWLLVFLHSPRFAGQQGLEAKEEETEETQEVEEEGQGRPVGSDDERFRPVQHREQ
jgi:hypothetical protein